MMKKNIVLILLCCFYSFSYGQVDNKVALPSADVAKMMTPANINISYYTGRPSVNLPIYTIQDGDITIPISLNYYSGGIKYGEIASKVGLGWDLSVGGAVTRTVRGLPDELPKFGYLKLSGQQLDYYNYAETVANRIGISFFHAVYYTTSNREETLQWRASYSFLDEYNIRQIDFEPDLYTFSFMGHSGQFVKKRDQIIFQTGSDIKMLKTGAESIYNFKDLQGYEYQFPTGNENTEFVYINATSIANNESDFPSTRYLDKIISPIGEIAKFSYDAVDSKQGKDYRFWDGRQTNYLDIDRIAGLDPCGSNVDYSGSGSSGITQHRLKIIKKIETRNYIVIFEHSTNDFRKDTGSNNRIDAIKVYYREGSVNKLIKNIAFSYDYFEGTDYNPVNKTAFLKLTQVDEVSIENPLNKINLYEFDYHDNVIPTTEFYTDFWGYPTNNESGSSFPVLSNGRPTPEYNRHTDPDFVYTGMLAKITYAMKSFTKFDWEANTYTHIGNLVNSDSEQMSDPPVYEKTNQKLLWNLNPNYRDVLFTTLKNTPNVILSARSYYPGGGEQWVENSPHLQDWYDYSANGWLKGDLSHRVNQDGGCMCTDSEVCSFGGHKTIYEEMPIVYFVKEGVDASNIKNIFKDSRVVKYVILSNEFTLKGGELPIHLPLGNYSVFLKPGTVKKNSVVEGRLKDNAVAQVDIEYLTEMHPASTGIERRCGGARIKQIVNSDNERTYIKSFEYLNGVLTESPRMAEQFNKVSICRSREAALSILLTPHRIERFHSRARDFSTTSGSHIGYSMVIEREHISREIKEGPFKTTYYHYSTAKDEYGTIQDKDLSLIQYQYGLTNVNTFKGGNNLIANGTSTSYDHHRGLLLQKRETSRSREEVTDYTYKIAEDPSVYTDKAYILSGLYLLASAVEGGYREDNAIHSPKSLVAMRAGILNPAPTGRIPENELTSTFLEDGTSYIIGRYKLIPYTKYLLSEKVTININGESSSKLISYEYMDPDLAHNDYQSRYLPKAVVIKNLQGREESRTEYTYNPKGAIRSKNEIVNGKLVAALKNEYNTQGLLTVEKEAKIGLTSNVSDLAYRTKMQYEYNSFGYLIKSIENESLLTTYAWNRNRLRGKFVNLDNVETLTDCFSTNKLDKNAHITCITYDFLFPDRVASVEEANGNTTYYEYDEFGRLTYIKDALMNVLKYYKYNYKD